MKNSSNEWKKQSSIEKLNDALARLKDKWGLTTEEVYVLINRNAEEIVFSTMTKIITDKNFYIKKGGWHIRAR